MATQISPTSSNLINQSVQNKVQTKPQKPVEGKSVAINKELNNKDTFTPLKKHNNKNETLYKILNFISTTALLVGVWFLPNIISLLRNKNAFKHSAFKKLEKIKPIIEKNETTRQSTAVLKNGNIKADISTYTSKGLLHEIFILTPKGDVKKRILIRKVMSNGKYTVKNVKSYEGSGVEDNAKLEENVEKYLVKEYKRVNEGYENHHITVKRAGKPEENTKLYCAKDGDPIFSIKETSDNKIQTKYLYSQDRLIGTDRIITAKDGSSEKNICTIPEMDIINKEYDPKVSMPYSKSYLEKLNKGF